MNTVMIIILSMSQQAGPGPQDHRLPDGPGTLGEPSMLEPRMIMTRSTRQAQAVAAILPAMPGFRSARQIHALLRARGERVGLATVYRHLRMLAEHGSVDTVHGGNGEMLYRQRRVALPHYNLTCRICGASVEADASEVRRWAERVAARAGFTGVAGSVELSGLCPAHAGR